MKHLTELLSIEEINEASQKTEQIYLIIGESGDNTWPAEWCQVFKYNATKTELKLLEARVKNGKFMQSDGKTMTDTKNKFEQKIKNLASKKFGHNHNSLRIFGFCKLNNIEELV